MTEEQARKDFLEVCANHQMEIIKDDGVHRHIRFANPTSFEGRFELVTWNACLCIQGDYGAYVFSRVMDMFTFFRGDRINPDYWAEKALSQDRISGIKEYSPEIFISSAVDCYKSLSEGVGREMRVAGFRELRKDVLTAAHDGEHGARDAADCFEFEGLSLLDFWEYDLTEYTGRFLWNLWAIVYGIKWYDQGEVKC